MRILIVDTTTANLYAVVIDGDKQFSANILNCKNKHSESLIGSIAEVLKKADLTFDMLDAYAVSIGPGSFTGIRIGVSTVKGIALAVPKKLIGINNLMLTAFDQGDNSAVIDAGNGYYYQQFDGIKAASSPELVGYDDERINTAVKFDNSKDYSGSLVELAKLMYEGNVFSDTLQPLYIRKSQAEVNNGN